MSRFVRMSHWSDPNHPPLTIVLPEESLKRGTVFDALEETREAGFFVTYSVFDDDDLLSATLKAQALETSDLADERNMAIAYFYYVRALQSVVPGGFMASTTAPLAREEMAWVLRCVAAHEAYRGQHLCVPLEDGTTIEMKEGEVLPA